MDFDFTGNKPQLIYPCQWVYKLIGFFELDMRSAVEEILPGRPYVISFSNYSKKGKYCSLNLELQVESEGERNLIFEKLKKHQNIKMVL